MAYPYEYFNLDILDKPFNLTKEYNTETRKSPQKQFNCTQEIIKMYGIESGYPLTMLYLKMDVIQLADVFENFVEQSTLEYGINPLYNYSAPGYTWRAGLKLTNIK